MLGEGRGDGGAQPPQQIAGLLDCSSGLRPHPLRSSPHRSRLPRTLSCTRRRASSTRSSTVCRAWMRVSKEMGAFVLVDCVLTKNPIPLEQNKSMQTDVRVLLNNDALLKDGASGAFAKYNEDQFTPAKVEGAAKEVIVAAPGLQADGTYIDPRTKQTFNFDHLRKVRVLFLLFLFGGGGWSFNLLMFILTPPFEQEATAAGSADGGDEIESFRAAFEKAADDYVEDHYPNGVCSVCGACSYNMTSGSLRPSSPPPLLTPPFHSNTRAQLPRRLARATL